MLIVATIVMTRISIVNHRMVFLASIRPSNVFFSRRALTVGWKKMLGSSNILCLYYRSEHSSR